jgi:NADH-ubiquinone oxidoreductase chain 5
MAAPTPVSALVHSSTLVTAGVYLVIRFSTALGRFMCTFHLLFSSLTMFMAGLGANFEYDLKKNYCSFYFESIGFNGWCGIGWFVDLAFFHLLTHVLFNAFLYIYIYIYIYIQIFFFCFFFCFESHSLFASCSNTLSK